MGQVYWLKKGELEFKEAISENFIIKKPPLCEDEAEGLISIQEEVFSEISEQINILTKKGLICSGEHALNGLLYCLVKNDKDEYIGYGYGYFDFDNKYIFYIDTIGVKNESRRKDIGTKITVKLAQEAFLNPNIERVKVK